MTKGQILKLRTHLLRQGFKFLTVDGLQWRGEPTKGWAAYGYSSRDHVKIGDPRSFLRLAYYINEQPGLVLEKLQAELDERDREAGICS